MSDRLEGYDLNKFKQNISLSTEHCLNYVKQDCIDGDNIAFTVNIPNEHLRSWRDLREEGGLLCQFSRALQIDRNRSSKTNRLLDITR